MAGTSLDRRKILGCANPNCPFRVCPDPELGGFCCISCYESFTYGVELTHTNRCQQSRAASWLPRAPPEAPKAILSSSGPGAQHSSPIAAAPIRAPILRGSVATLIAPAADTRPIVSPAVVRPAAPAVVRPAAPAVVRPAAPAVVRPAAPVVVRPAAPVVVAPAAPVVAPAAPVVVAPAAPIVTPAKIIAPRKRLAPGGPLGSVAKSRARPKASWMEGSAPIKAWSNIYSVPTWMVSHEDLEEAMPEVEDEIVQEDCDGGHLPDTGKLSFSLGAVFEATDVYEVDPTLDEIELPTPKAPPKAKAPLLTPAQVPAANRDAEETVVFELEELEELQETPEIVRILPCDDDDRQLDYAGMRVEALARAEARMAFGLFTAADLKYLRKNLKKRPPVGFTLFRDEASQELRSVCRTCLQVCRSPAMSCAATPAMRAEQTETSPTVVSSGPVSVTKQEEDMMMARLLREINETNGAASAAATVISPARLGLAVSLAPSGTLL